MKLFTTLLTVALLAAGLSTQAQTKPAARRTPPPRPVVKNAGVRDGVMMVDGKVMLTENGHTNQLAEPRTLTNGTKIAADGTVTKADGSTVTLVNGDYMSLSGRLTTAAMKAEQDSLMQAAKMDPKGKMKMKKKGKN
ncbi:hypothetical protein F0P96_08340 [Hymenobacter busanensis]|uniref:Uncharacterized protein n=1 Tax=Hymenobacter busanensis TaxID=2607656 RepID=A0A7L5A1P3_9BACT|nr:DUF6799 domain-containing protein [Hymenobacter busanensis]KAA9332984.1 hypothetical protein F0P96_08340 [Hymenobacter busanensis]QHJ08342.1 hypothetical protein GUY19_13990 [Hymenobacter busanensis]